MAERFEPHTPSFDHCAMEPYWTEVHALMGGAKAVREVGERFLPKFPDEEHFAYEYRRRTAKYTNICGDIVTSLAAKPFRKEVGVKAGSTGQVMAFAEDVDGQGNNLHVFAAETFFRGIQNAIDWILVDAPKADPSIRTLADQRRAGWKPYWVHIEAPRMLDVRTASVSGRVIFTHARILETSVEREGFKESCVERVRIYDRALQADGTYGAPTWQVYQRAARGNQWEVVDSGVLGVGFIPLVPFITGRRVSGSWRFVPALQGVFDLQIEHYQQESALKQAREMTAFPMLTGQGVDPGQAGQDGKGAKIRVGPRSVLFAPPAPSGSQTGKWEFIEPAGSSLKFLADQIKETEDQMRELGRQPLTAQTGNLTVVSTAFAAARSNSVISAWALNLKDALEQALKFTCAFMSDASEPEVEIEDQFDVDTAGEDDATTLLTMRDKGDLSQITLWSEMKRRGILSPEFEAEAEQDRIINETPDPDSATDLGAAITPMQGQEAA